MEIWRVLLKGNSWYLESGHNVHTMVFQDRTNTFWSCFQYLHDFRRILMLKLRIIFPIVRALIIFFSEDSSLVNSPEYSQLQSHPCLVKPYPFLLNNAGSDFSHMVWMESCKWLYCLKLSPQLFICMQLVECRLCLKTYWENEKKSHC